MKRYLLLAATLTCSFALMAGASLVYGQKSEQGNQEKAAEGTNSGSVKEPQKEQPDTFKEDAHRTFRDLNSQIHALGKKARSQWAGAEGGAKEAWEDVKVKQKAAKKQVKEMSSAGKDTWEHTKSKTKEALDDLRKSFDRAKAYFK
jgi:hypothetical protein